MLIIGKVLRPHGVRGSLKIQSYMDTPYSFSEMKTIFVKGIEYKIEKVQPSDSSVILKLEGIDSIEDAQNLRNAELTTPKEQAPELPQGRFYIDDLIGCKVFSNKKEIGELFEILQYGSADIYCVNGKKKVMFPYVGNVVESIDIKNKKIVLNEDEFQKVAVYED